MTIVAVIDVECYNGHVIGVTVLYFELYKFVINEMSKGDKPNLCITTYPLFHPDFQAQTDPFWHDKANVLEKLKYQGTESVAEMYATAAKQIHEEFNMHFYCLNDIRIVVGTSKDICWLSNIGVETDTDINGKYNPVTYILRSMCEGVVPRSIGTKTRYNAYTQLRKSSALNEQIYKRLATIFEIENNKVHDPEYDVRVNLVLYLTLVFRQGSPNINEFTKLLGINCSPSLIRTSNQ